MQVINDPYRSVWGSIGASLGTGIGKGLQLLAHMKVQQLQQRHQQEQTAKGLEALGIPQEKAKGLSNLSSQALSSVTSEYAPMIGTGKTKSQLALKKSGGLALTPNVAIPALAKRLKGIFPEDKDITGKAIPEVAPIVNYANELYASKVKEGMSPENAINLATREAHKRSKMPKKLKSMGFNDEEVDTILSTSENDLVGLFLLKANGDEKKAFDMMKKAGF